MIGFMIKKRRIQIGLTQQQLADMTGIKKNTISNYENDVSSPSEENILKIMTALECDANYLFNKEENSQLSAQAVMADKIKSIREAYRITQSQLAEIAGTTEERVSEWEKGIKMPSPDRIRAICQYFKISPTELLDKTKELVLSNSIDPKSVITVSRQEADLLYYFNQLNNEGQEAILSMASAFAGMPQYKKCDTDDANLKNA